MLFRQIYVPVFFDTLTAVTDSIDDGGRRGSRILVKGPLDPLLGGALR